MINSYFVFDEFRNILAIIVSELILAMPGFKRQQHFWLRLSAGTVLCLAVSTLYVHLHSFFVHGADMGLILSVSAGWYTLMLVFASALIAVCFSVNLTELLWIALTGYAAQHIAYIVVYEILLMGILLPVADKIPYLLVYTVIALLIDFCIFRIFYSSLKDRERLYVTHSVKNALMFGLVLIVFLASTFLNQYSAIRDYQSLNVLAVASDLINCVFVLMVQYMSLRNARINAEKETVVTLLENEKRQYETFRNAVEYINIKCHDLKKEIASMAKEGQLDADYIDEIVQQVGVYESFVHTGNATLDSLLTDKNLLCLKKKIALSVMADASGLDFMKKRDLYVLFSNMIDNAIECVTQLPQSQNRYIRLLIRRTGNMTVIHQENMLLEPLQIKGSLPATTKADKSAHGFGMKSMERIVRKYGGCLRIDTDKEMFRMELIIPENQTL